MTMKKIILLFAMIFAVAGVQAKKDKFACNQTLSSSYSWTGANKQIQLFESLSSVDKAKFKNLHVKISNKSNINHVTLKIMCAGNYSTASWHKDYYTSTEFTVDLTAETYKDENTDATARTYSDISRIYLNVVSSDISTEASFDISAADIYLETDEYECMTLSTDVTGMSWFGYSDDKDYSINNISKNLGNSLGQNGIIYGPTSASATSAYMDVSSFDNVAFTLTTAGTAGIRLMYDTDVTTIETNSTDLTYTQSLSSLPKIANIKTKNVSGISNIVVSNIDFVKEFLPTSATAFNMSKEVNKTEVAYDRTFTAGQKATVCLPFALTAAEVTAVGKFYELSSASGSSLTFSEVSETEAYKPYIFEPKTTGAAFASLTNKTIAATPANASDYATTVGDYTFKGTLAQQSLADGVYGYQGGDFVKTSGSGVSIKAFRGYIKANTSAHSLDVVFDGETTGIENVKQAKAVSNVMYNLQGQRVSEGHKGLVIINGKKVIVK